MEFSRQECWSSCHFLLQGDLPDAGIELMFPTSLILQVDSLLLEPLQKPLTDPTHPEKSNKLIPNKPRVHPLP